MPVNEDKSGILHIRLEPSVYKLLKAEADFEALSISAFTRTIIYKYLRSVEALRSPGGSNGSTQR